MFLSDTAKAFRAGKWPKPLADLLARVRRLFDFAQERDNRHARFVKIVEAYEARQPVALIEREFQCSKSTVLRYARLAQLDKRPKCFPADLKRAVLADVEAKVPFADIVRLHGVSQAYVSKVAKAAGLNRYKNKSAQNA